jgi:hypothetical protein
MAKEIKRTPVVTPTKGGVAGPKTTVGKLDPVKGRIAKMAMGAGGFGMQRQAGMMLDMSQDTSYYQSGYTLEGYRTSYAYGLGSRSGTYDVPRYFVQMNQQNGGVLYWPVTLREKYEWYRYWARCFTDPNTPITRPDGTEAPLCGFKPGDEVINAKGEITRIKEVTKKYYEGAVISLDVEGNRQDGIEVTPEHPFFVLRENKIIRHHNRVKDDDGVEHRKTNVEIDYAPEWMNAEDIKVGDCLIVPRTNVGSGLELTIEKSRLVGYYLAEGNVNLDRKGEPEAVTWSLGTHEPVLIEEIVSLCELVTGDSPSVYWCEDKKTSTTIRLWNREFAAWISENCGTGSRHKRLSRELFNLQDEDRIKHLLACWLNGDGYREYDGSDAAERVSGTTCSDFMAHQLYLMASRAGLCLAKNPSDSYEFGGGDVIGTGWRLRIACHSANELSAYTKWESYEVSDRYRKYNHKGNLLLPVREITKRTYSGYIWNFETEGEDYDDRTFLAHGVATHNTDAYIGRALELLSDLPMSKLTLTMPKATKKLTKEKRESILRFFKYQMEVIGGFETCQSILWEWNMIGSVFMFHEWDDEKKMWSRAVMLPPEEVGVFEYPFQKNKRVEYRPERLIKLIKDSTAYGTSEGSSQVPGADTEGNRADMTSKILEGIPQELVDMVKTEGCIVMDSDPMTGSFVHYIGRRKSPYMDLGSSVLERVLIPMLQKEHFRYTQLSLASRNMTPKNIVTAPGLLRDELDDLRTQVDLSYLDPEYTIVTNYEVTWEQIGAQDRLLDLDREYERIEREIFAAMGVTRELLTGESTYSGSKITVDILNTMFLLTREVLQGYIERSLFIPVCEAHGWYDEDENGIKDYWYPKVGFNRLTIRDNAEVFDSLFQLYQKGSIPVDIIYELFNLNSDEIDTKLLEDLFTVKDSNFNRIVEEASSEVGRAVVERTDLAERVAKYLTLKYQNPEEGAEGGAAGEDGGFGDFGGFGEDQTEGQPTDESSSLDVEAIAEGIASNLPDDVTDEDIQRVVEEVSVSV